MEGPSDVESRGDSVDVRIAMPPASVSFIILSKKEGRSPAKVGGLKYEKYKSLNGENDIMLLWNPLENKNVLTYEVFFARKGMKEFKKVNAMSIMDGAFVHTLPKGVECGRYKVRAVDLMNS